MQILVAPSHQQQMTQMAPPAHHQATLVRQSGEEVLVNACGRTCAIEKKSSQSYNELQKELRHSLKLQDQHFNILDVNGTLLSNDVQVQTALQSGLTPFTAKLSDKSLHTLEIQREELGQMQWKLVRDELSSTGGQMAALARQLNELQFQMGNNMREQQSQIALVREDLYKAIDNERAAVKEDMTVLTDSVNASLSVMTGEKSKRELAVQGFEKHLHGVCDMLDSERTTRRQDMAMHMTILQELRTKFDQEKENREALEDNIRLSQDRTQQVRDDLITRIEGQLQSAIRTKGETDVVFSEMRARFTEIEDRCNQIENAMAESATWHATNVERLGTRHERVAETLGSMRVSESTNQHQIKSVVDSIHHLDSTMKETDKELREFHLKERQFREDQIMRTHKSLLSDQTRQVSDLEKRLNLRLQEESAEREKSYQWLCDEMTALIRDGKHREYPKKIPGPGQKQIQGSQSVEALVSGRTSSQHVSNREIPIALPQEGQDLSASAKSQSNQQVRAQSSQEMICMPGMPSPRQPSPSMINGVPTAGIPISPAGSASVRMTNVGTRSMPTNMFVGQQPAALMPPMASAGTTPMGSLRVQTPRLNSPAGQTPVTVANIPVPATGGLTFGPLGQAVRV